MILLKDAQMISEGKKERARERRRRAERKQSGETKGRYGKLALQKWQIRVKEYTGDFLKRVFLKFCRFEGFFPLLKVKSLKKGNTL